MIGIGLKHSNYQYLKLVVSYHNLLRIWLDQLDWRESLRRDQVFHDTRFPRKARADNRYKHDEEWSSACGAARTNQEEVRTPDSASSHDGTHMQWQMSRDRDRPCYFCKIVIEGTRLATRDAQCQCQYKSTAEHICLPQCCINPMQLHSKNSP